MLLKGLSRRAPLFIVHTHRINIIRELLLFIILALGIGLLVYFGWNYRAFLTNVRYNADAAPDELGFAELRSMGALDVTRTPTESSGLVTTPSPTPTQGSGQAATAEPVPAGAASPAPTRAPSPVQKAILLGYQLVIPKINVNVPIAGPKDDSTPAVLKSLEEGVGLYPGSDLPGEPGRAVLLGHSSRASWYNGEYAYVFSLLPKLEVFDQFTVVKGNTTYTYQVFSKEFLSPEATNAILAGPSAGSEIDLITCYPIGSASQRTLIRAVLIDTQTAGS